MGNCDTECKSPFVPDHDCGQRPISAQPAWLWYREAALLIHQPCVGMHSEAALGQGDLWLGFQRIKAGVFHAEELSLAGTFEYSVTLHNAAPSCQEVLTWFQNNGPSGGCVLPPPCRLQDI